VGKKKKNGRNTNDQEVICYKKMKKEALSVVKEYSIRQFVINEDLKEEK